MAQAIILKTLKANPAQKWRDLLFGCSATHLCTVIFDDLRRLRNRIYGREFRFMEGYQYIGHIFNFHHYII